MFSQVYSIVGDSLCLALIVLLVVRHVWQRLVFLTIFMSLCITRDAITIFVIRTAFGHGVKWFYIYWIAEIILTVMYLLMIAEISNHFLSDYPSIRPSAFRLLGVVTLALSFWTATSAMRYAGHPRMFFTTGEQHLVLTITIVLLLLMGIVVYYRLRLPPLYRLVLFGIGIYASIVMGADQIELQFRLGPNSVFDYVRRAAFSISAVIWTYAVWRWPAPSARHLELIPQSEYDDLSPQVHDRLREANLKLANLKGEGS